MEGAVVRWTTLRSSSTDRSETETEYITLEMRDLENQEIGEKRGEKKGKKEMIIQMLNNGRSPEQIAEFCGIPVIDVQNIQDEELIGAMA